MQIQVNTDRTVEGGDQLVEMVEGKVQAALDRFADRITRVEAHLSDVDGEKRGGDPDKRCVLEARPAGKPPVAVTGVGDTLAHACDDANRKMLTRLARSFGRGD